MSSSSSSSGVFFQRFTNFVVGLCFASRRTDLETDVDISDVVVEKMSACDV